MIAEYGSFFLFSHIGYCLIQHSDQAVTVKDIVTQHHTHIIITNKICAQYKGLR